MTEPPDEFKQIAWASFLNWAVGDPAMVASFIKDTGKNLLTDMPAFVEWVTRKHYGLEHAPEAYQRSLEKTA